MYCQWRGRKRYDAQRADDGGCGPAAEADQRYVYYSWIESAWVSGGKGFCCDKMSACVVINVLKVLKASDLLHKSEMAMSVY